MTLYRWRKKDRLHSQLTRAARLDPLMPKAEFDNFADEYDEDHRKNIGITGELPEYFSEQKIKELANIVKRGAVPVSSIFDFGSGIGNSIPYFQKYFANSLLVSADVSVRSLKICRSRFPAFENLLLIETSSLPVESNSFDVTFSSCVFHHIPVEEQIPWLKELNRITRPGGLIAVFEHNPLNPLTLYAVTTCPFDRNAKLISARSMLRKLRGAGWKTPSVLYQVYFPRGLARLRPLEQYLTRLPLGAQYVAIARK